MVFHVQGVVAVFNRNAASGAWDRTRDVVTIMRGSTITVKYSVLYYISLNRFSFGRSGVEI